MAIILNHRTKLTTEAERLLVELGGADPDKTLSKSELSTALVNATTELARQGKTRLLEKLYLSYRKDQPSLPALEELREAAARADAEEASLLEAIAQSDNVVLLQRI